MQGKSFSVVSADGVKLFVREWGRADGPSILLIHGLNQCHLAWKRQYGDAALADAFRMVAFDLRGHGLSDKPEGDRFYREEARWAGDVAAVIAAARLHLPVLVGWSYGGRVITDYLQTFGTSEVSGLNFVGAAFHGGSNVQPGGGGGQLRALVSDDPEERIEAVKSFSRACFGRQPSPDEYETVLAYNMISPVQSLRPMRGRPITAMGLHGRIDVPVLLSHGDADALISVDHARQAALAIPNARLSIYEGIGHSPFFEDAPRFNRELLAFATAAKDARAMAPD